MITRGRGIANRITIGRCTELLVAGAHVNVRNGVQKTPLMNAVLPPPPDALIGKEFQFKTFWR